MTAGLAVAEPARAWSCRTAGPAQTAQIVAELERSLSPRWIWWSADRTATPLVRHDVRVAACWDLAAVHRVVHGGSRAEPATVWAGASGLDLEAVPLPTAASRDLGDQLDLLGRLDSPRTTVRPWTPGRCAATATCTRAASRRPTRPRPRWRVLAALAAQVQERQLEQLSTACSEHLADPTRRTAFGDPRTTARSESAAALLCVELSQDGLPIDRAEAERLIGDIIGPRPADDAGRIAGAAASRFRCAATCSGPSAPTSATRPRSATCCGRSASTSADTRSWRLEPFRGLHPVVEPLLAWRKAERIETTYGYTWLDRDVGPDGRLRGSWQASDGAAGRMTAQSGLHNLPVELRSAVAAEPGMVFVRADLGQIEPRVLAAVSADPGLVAATLDDDLYQPVASQLRVERPVAKIAVLAAMYGQTSGAAGQALRRMEVTYPRALAALQAAEAAGRSGRPITTYGGRHVPVWTIDPAVADLRSAESGRGRFTRNAADPGRGRRAVQGLGGGDPPGAARDRRADRALPARRAARPCARRDRRALGRDRGRRRWNRLRGTGFRAVPPGSSSTCGSSARWSEAKD